MNPNDYSKTVIYQIKWLMRGWLMCMIDGHKFNLGCELGTYNGNTAFFLLDNAPWLTLHTVDIFEQQPEHEDYHRETYNFKEKFPAFMEKAQKYGDRLIVHKGWTHEVATEFKDESLDFVFIDADHTYEGCKRDILAWKSKVKPEGLLMGHDAHFPGVIQAVTECCKNRHVNTGTYCWAGS